MNNEKLASSSVDEENEQLRERILELEQDRQEHVLDNLPDGFMIFDKQWRYRYINRQARAYTGKPWHELLGKIVWEEFPNLVGSIYYQQYHYAMLQQKPVSFEIYSLVLSSWFTIRAYPIPDGLAVYFHDITSRKQAEEVDRQLLETEQKAHADAETAKQRITSIWEGITDAFFVLNTEWQFTYLNALGELLFRRTSAELLGKNIWEEFPELIGSVFEQQYHLAVEHQTSISFEAFYPLLENWFEVRVYPTREGLSVYYHNINVRKLAEEERVHLLSLAEQARHEAESALQVRNDFLSSVSHDLKTPLAVMRGNVQLLQRRINRGATLDPNWSLERLAAIEAATMKMNYMVEELLDVAKLQAGQLLDLEVRSVSLIPLLQQITAELQETTHRHQLMLHAPAEELLVQGDRVRLDRVFTNLLTNAIKYSPQGGPILIDVGQEEVQDQQWAIVSIQDQGIGIPPADLPHIFDPFYRAGNVVGRIQGTGVGLASSFYVIAQHGGTISASSEGKQGSTFVIRLPYLVNETENRERTL